MEGTRPRSNTPKRLGEGNFMGFDPAMVIIAVIVGILVTLYQSYSSRKEQQEKEKKS